MADAVESKDFRRYARQNGYRYGQGAIAVYKDDSVTLRDYGLPTYSLRSSVGAIESLVGLIQNTDQGTNGDPKQKLAKNIPGAQTSDTPNFEVHIAVSGPMYLLDYNDYTKSLRAIDSLAHQFGWDIIGSGISRVYRPSSRASKTGAGLYSEDPITAGNRAMMQSALTHITSAAGTIRGALGGGTDADYAKNSVLLERSGFQQTFSSFGDAFKANTGSGVAGAWRDAGWPLEAYRGGALVERSINLVPSSLKVTPRAYVVDKSSNGRMYPTVLDISIDLVNLYGALIMAGTDL